MDRSPPVRGTVGILADGFLGLLLEECLADDGYQVAFRALPGALSPAWIAQPPDVLLVEVTPGTPDLLAVLCGQWGAAPMAAVIVIGSPPPPSLAGIPGALWVPLPFGIDALLAAVAQQRRRTPAGRQTGA